MWLEALAAEAERSYPLPEVEPWDGAALLELLSNLAPEPLQLERELKAALALGFHLALAGNLAEGCGRAGADPGELVGQSQGQPFSGIVPSHHPEPGGSSRGHVTGSFFHVIAEAA